MKFFYFLVIGGMMIFSCGAKQPETLGIHNGRLTDCPGRPNCVSSQASGQESIVAPFQYQGGRQMAFKRLKKAAASLKRTKIVTETDNYLHIECKSAIMGFVDDLEFYFPKEKIIHVRSASRLGYSDFNVNRKRIERLRKLFAEK